MQMVALGILWLPYSWFCCWEHVVSPRNPEGPLLNLLLRQYQPAPVQRKQPRRRRRPPRPRNLRRRQSPCFLLKRRSLARRTTFFLGLKSQRERLTPPRGMHWSSI